MTDDAVDHFDVDLDDDDLNGTSEHDEGEAGERTGATSTALDEDVVGGPEPVEVRKARRALKAARSERRTALSRLRLAEERVVNAAGKVKVEAGKAVDYEQDEKKKPHQVEAANEAVERARRALARLELERDERKAEADDAAGEVASADDVLTAVLAEAADTATEAAAGKAKSKGDKEPPPQLYYANVVQFFDEYLRWVYQRAVDGKTTFWDPEWWRSDEAVNRLEAIWRAWEHLRLDPATGASVVWRDHFDPHMKELMSPRGPFRRMTNVEAGRYDVSEPLPHTPPPAGLFRDERQVVDPPPPKTPDGRE